jgi:hypothetical protein
MIIYTLNLYQKLAICWQVKKEVQRHFSNNIVSLVHRGGLLLVVFFENIIKNYKHKTVICTDLRVKK